MLVIIDIQEFYIDEFRKQQKSFNKMIAGIRNRVGQARQNEELVINLTRFEDGFTLPEIVELIKSCNKGFFLGKDEEDGSTSLHCFCKRKNIKPKSIELCGIFQDICVLETWKGLKRLGYKVLSVNKCLTLATSTNWRKTDKYPDGYLKESKMKFNTEEENAAQLKEKLHGNLPEENEIIITEEGLIVIDEEGPLRPEELGTPVGDSILCGC